MAIGAPISLLAYTAASDSRQAEAPVSDAVQDETWLVKQLARRCVAGDSAAWEQIVRRFQRRVYNLCYRFCGSADDAEDLTQEVFLKVYRTIGSFDGTKAAFATWLTAVGRNLLVDHYRSQRNDRITDSLDVPLVADNADGPARIDCLAAAEPSPHEQTERRERRQLIQQALQQVSAELREAVILRDLQEMGYKEIAQVLAVPEGTVKSRINRGRAELARVLQRMYGQTR